MEYSKANYRITDDMRQVDIDFVVSMLADAYWACGRPRSVIEDAIRNSINFSIFKEATPVGYARVVTDTATFAWIADVVISPDHRGQGLGKWLLACILDHPAIGDASQKLLRTRDAHGLYRQFGFERAECMARKDLP